MAQHLARYAWCQTVRLSPRTERDVFVLSGIGYRMHDHRGDICDLDTVLRVFAKEQPEIVFHLAAQPLVLESYADPVGTFATNTQGTAHILEAIRRPPSVRATVLVTTDKCYENREWLCKAPYRTSTRSDLLLTQQIPPCTEHPLQHAAVVGGDAQGAGHFRSAYSLIVSLT